MVKPFGPNSDSFSGVPMYIKNETWQQDLSRVPKISIMHGTTSQDLDVMPRPATTPLSIMRGLFNVVASVRVSLLVRYPDG